MNKDKYCLLLDMFMFTMVLSMAYALVSTEELVASELQQDFQNLRVRSKDSAHAARRTVTGGFNDIIS